MDVYVSLVDWRSARIACAGNCTVARFSLVPGKSNGAQRKTINAFAVFHSIRIYIHSDRVFTYTRIHRPSDCAITCMEDICSTVTLSPPIALSDKDKLEALRRLDQFRQWRSLDEKRFCLVCGKIVTGRQIQVAGGTRGNGALRLSCPTEHCNSIPMDWVLPTDEILAKVERMVAEEREAAALSPIVGSNGGPEHPDKAQDSIASRLRRFAFSFRRHP